MNFNPDPAKQAQKLIDLFFFAKCMINHPFLFFNQNIVVQTSFKVFRNVVR